MTDTGIIILAAGNSSRLGRPKQLLSFQNKSLIEHIVDETLAAELNPVIVVTGAHADAVSLSLKSKEVIIIYNENWKEGMGSGIRAGLSKMMLTDDTIEGVIIAVCDQPYVSAELFTALLQTKNKTGKGIAACSYANTIGTPVLFHGNYFKHLLSLKETDGAKSLIKMYKDDVATLSFPEGGIDIDTEDDYKNLLFQHARTFKKG